MCVGFTPVSLNFSYLCLYGTCTINIKFDCRNNYVFSCYFLFPLVMYYYFLS